MSSSILLVLAVLLGGAAGMVAPNVDINHSLVLISAAAIQVALSVGGLPPVSRYTARAPQEHGTLLKWHYLVGALPWIVLWFGWVLAAGAPPAVIVGLTVLAAMPASAGLPAYAAAAGVDPRRVTRLAVVVYLVAPALTPVLLVATVGASDPLDLVLQLVLTLVLPTLLGLGLRRWIAQIRPTVRFVAVLSAMLASSFVFGQSLRPEEASLPTAVVVGAVLAGVARVLLGVGAALARTRKRPDLRWPLVFSTAFRNDALAATLAYGVAGPVAMLPAVTSMVAMMVVVLVAAARNGGSAVVADPDGRPEERERAA